MTDNYIYAILNKGDNVVKIGFSNDPYRRLGQIQTNTIHPLELLLTFKGDCTVEKAIHEKLKEYRISGEWFRYTPQLFSVLSDFMAIQFNAARPTAPRNTITSSERVIAGYKEFTEDLIQERNHLIDVVKETKDDLEILSLGLKKLLVANLGVSEDFPDLTDNSFLVEIIAHLNKTSVA
jgi:hypothetical protein